MLCYELDGYTKYINPLKLHEYLASGRPTIGSPIPICLDFAHVINLAQTPEEWATAIEKALSPTTNSPEQIAARRRVARQHDWNILVRKIAEALCKRLGPTYLERFEKLP